MESPDFPEFLAALRAGDQAASAELVRRYEPYLHRVIHLRLIGGHGHHDFDTRDVCQSALARFSCRAAAGRFVLHSADELRRLLTRIALNQLISRLRGARVPMGPLPAAWEPADPGRPAEERVADDDLVRAIRGRLTDRERRVLDGRAAGYSWAELAREVGGNPDALRILHARVVARVRREFQDVS